MRFGFALLLFTITFMVEAKFQLKQQYPGALFFENSEKNARIVKRDHKKAIPIPIDQKTIRKIAQTRFQVLKESKMGFHDFQIEAVRKKPFLIRSNAFYVWSGSYKSRNGKIHFVTEFVGKNHTYNVFTDQSHNSQVAEKMLMEII